MLVTGSGAEIGPEASQTAGASGAGTLGNANATRGIVSEFSIPTPNANPFGIAVA
jgi:hypothetical protein